MSFQPSPRLKIRKFVTRSGQKMAFPELGFGTAPIGNLYRALTEKDARATLDAAWDSGCRLFDTAPFYGLGLAETRLNGFLREKQRDSYVLSTKVGRLLENCPTEARAGIGKFYDTPTRREIFDYSYDGVMRSLEFSLERLGVDRIDVVFAHDLDVYTHGTQAATSARIHEFMEGGYKALDKLRSEGTIKAFGAGINEWQAAQTMAMAGDFDIFLLAGRYTLLEQESLETFLPLCIQKNIGIFLGGPFNSGILATGPKPGAFYNYEKASRAIRDRVQKIELICERHKTRLAEAAIRFPLGHPSILSVIPGGQKAAEVRRNREMINTKIPTALWRELKREGLLRNDAPVPK